jgi:class 3 adenylate cyclase
LLYFSKQHRPDTVMQHISDWLEKLGLSEYADRFAENDIDFEILGELTDTDFDRLGISIGHRRKLLKALAAGVPTSVEAPGSKSATDSAERRQVTVMFSDLVGSTTLAAPHGPRGPARGHFGLSEAFAATVRRFGGFVAKYLGRDFISLLGAVMTPCLC